MLFAFASKGTRELPNDTVVPRRRRSSALGRSGTFVGQHVYTSRPGVAVQINAFNFPVWGMLEKLAPGVPRRACRRIVKPASADVVPHRGGGAPRSSSPACCPRARCSCSPAAPAACSTSSTGQDLVAFTGSAHTAGAAAHPPQRAARRRAPQRRGRLAELLDPRPRRRPPDDAGVRPVRQGRRHRDDRQGRPEVHRDPARARAGGAGRRRHRGASPRGSPKVTRRRPRARRTCRMGALVEPRPARGGPQGDPVAARRRPRSCSATPTTSTSSTPTPSAARSSPRCCCAPTTGAVEPHDVEAFGPVSTVLATTPSTRRSSWPPAARAAWSARWSPTTPRSRATVVLGVAPWHGRVLVLDRDDAGGVDRPRLAAAARWCTAAPAAPAAARSSAASAAVLHHMQRTAVQGSPDMLTAITGRWIDRARARTRRRRRTRSARAWPSCGSATRSSSAPRHGHAGRHRRTSPSSPATRSTRTPTRRPPRRTRSSAGIVAHGYLVVSLAAGLFVDPDPGPGARQLRRRQPALPHPGQGRRHASR